MKANLVRVCASNAKLKLIFSTTEAMTMNWSESYLNTEMGEFMICKPACFYYNKQVFPTGVYVAYANSTLFHWGCLW